MYSQQTSILCVVLVSALYNSPVAFLCYSVVGHVHAEEDPESREESHKVPVHCYLPVSGGGVHQG